MTGRVVAAKPLHQ
jgi:hypothetical protein